MYLLDTNVVSELRKGSRADAKLQQWAVSVSPAHLFLSAVTILELEQGVLQKERKDSQQGAILRTWLMTHVLTAFADRILPMDTAVAQQCARLHVPDPRSERDALIAATALVHGLTLVTRNLKDFEGMEGLAIINPWQ